MEELALDLGHGPDSLTQEASQPPAADIFLLFKYKWNTDCSKEAMGCGMGELIWYLEHVPWSLLQAALFPPSATLFLVFTYY
jgi:hypothetical protein